MLFAFVGIALGYLKFNTAAWWRALTLAILLQQVVALLFSAHGSLADPAGDGLITRYVRQASGDGIEVALMALPVIAFAWALPLFWLWRASENRPSI